MTDGAPDGATPPEGGCTRRRLLSNAVLASGAVATGGAVAYPLGAFLMPPKPAESSVASVVAAKVKDVPPNTAVPFRMGSRPALLVRLADGSFRAFHAVCTHLSCIVQYRADKKQIWCACHNGFYDLTGRNVSGPPPRPLDSFQAHVLGEDVIVSKAP
jgi:Rieske Fe-S protein